MATPNTRITDMRGDLSLRCDDIEKALRADMAKIPVNLYEQTEHVLPLTQEGAEAAFGCTIRFFGNGADDSSAGQSTNIVQAGTVSEPTLVMGVGLIATGECMQTALSGASVSPIAGDTPCIGGCIGPDSVPGDPAARPASWEWGGPTWRAICALFQAYRLQFIISNRFLVFDELAGDVGMVTSNAVFQGFAGDIQVPAQHFIRKTNDKLAINGDSRRFSPQNTAGSECFPPPMGGVAFGHPRVMGVANRFFCLNRPILLLPGVPINVKLVGVENDISFHSSIIEEVTVLDETVDEAFNENLACGASGFGNVVKFPGGTLTLGVVLKGWALTPACCYDFMANWCGGANGVWPSIYGGANYLAGLINSNAVIAMVGSKLGMDVNASEQAAQAARQEAAQKLGLLKR
jgi:hypothetical protein